MVIKLEKTKHYYNELPSDYKEDYSIDAKSNKFTLIATLVTLILTVSVIALALSFIHFNVNLRIDGIKDLMIIIIGLVCFILYIILHELTHGLFYKIFTREKLKYGFTLTVAYCGVPTIYVKKIPMIITCLAPFVIFSIVFITPLFFVTNNLIYLVISILLGFHVGGCSGDLFATIIMIFKYHKKDILINDTGPKQTFYKKSDLE